MAKFAKEANKAAQALNTTTNTYAKAALIYYQQGLDDKQVKERTDLTVKMANVTGNTAKTVSEQLTAIWNNFDDGSRSLESYIDVITALGASTASSTTEIAEGLEKFAAIARTVGLSYEYATSALATVVAKTRQSADVVGTAFKTLFARIQDLELGKTLDDGTTLGRYSEALKAIGVNIKNANGELKDMDDILNELGAKWDQIDRGTQVAVAQAVGGTRQYQQLIAILDNWDYMQENLNVAAESEGTLSRQAEIYAESWEAAKNRVKASAEEIYHALLDDKFFISLTNGFSKFLNGINAVMESLGGLKGILGMIS
jgi:TP901 family phage tail tape measure protein